VEAARYSADGFEIGVHVSTRWPEGAGPGMDYTPAALRAFYARHLAAWRKRFPALPPPATIRTHNVVWSDWITQVKVEGACGIRMDTNFYHWPAEWLGNHPGFLTGSGIPMRFADVDGTTIDVYQAATQMTDESGQMYPETIDTLLDRALGNEGYVGAFVANVHTGGPGSDDIADAIVSSARARRVPVISAIQLLRWMDARNASSVRDLEWDGSSARFRLDVAPAADGLLAMVPWQWLHGSVAEVRLEGHRVQVETQRLKGIDYCVFPAVSGSYEVLYTRSGPEPHEEILEREGTRT
jgi:hypothetical protein